MKSKQAFKQKQMEYLRTWQRSPVTPGGHMHLKVLSPLSTHVPLLTQGSFEQGSRPYECMIKVSVMTKYKKKTKI